MITVGEQTGALPQMLNSVAEFFEEDVATALTAALALIEPAILIVMGVVVVFILISLYLPIFSLGQAAAEDRGNPSWPIHNADSHFRVPNTRRTSAPRLRPSPTAITPSSSTSRTSRFSTTCCAPSPSS